jgi:hypothetical protein
MNLSPILQRFVDKAPLPVMMRAVLQRAFDAVQLDRCSRRWRSSSTPANCCSPPSLS